MKDVKPGIKASVQKQVEFGDSAAALGNEGIKVLSSPAMILLMELASAKVLTPYLEEDERTVGIAFDIRHMAPTPIGMNVVASSELVEANGIKFKFHVEVLDDMEKIGEGTISMAVVKMERFLEGAISKKL